MIPSAQSPLTYAYTRSNSDDLVIDVVDLIGLLEV